MTIYKLLSLRNDLKAVCKGKLPQRAVRKFTYRHAFKAAGWLLRAVGLSMALATPVAAQDLTEALLNNHPAEVVQMPEVQSGRPLRDTLTWATIPLAGFAFDHQTSIDWSSHPTNCTEGNLSRRNADGTLDGWKAFKDEAVEMGVMVGSLYLVKRLGWKKAEAVVKVVIVARAAQSSYYGFKSLSRCHAVER